MINSIHIFNNMRPTYATPHLPQPQISHSTSSVPPSHQYQSQMSLAVLVFNQGDDLIACLNKAMAFISAVAASRFPSNNNQLRTSSNLRNQVTIQDGRVTVQQVQVRQVQSYTGAGNKGNATSSGANNAGGLARVVKCYNCQATIIHNDAFQTDDLDAYDSDRDDISSPKVVMMANLSNYVSDVLSEVPNIETYQNDMDNQSVQAMQHFEQTPVNDYPDNEITSDSNVIPYSQYLQETQQAAVQDTNSFVQQDSMILSVIEQMSEQMINHVTNWEKANQEK
ncbi:hypothetical protein Tco_0414918 [Tanacetum coccineum]